MIMGWTGLPGFRNIHVREGGMGSAVKSVIVGIVRIPGNRRYVKDILVRWFVVPKIVLLLN